MKCWRSGTSPRIFSTSSTPSGPEIMATEPECSALNFRSLALSWGAQGMAMAPSFKRPVRTACHSGTLPRRTITLSPRPTPSSLRRVGEPVREDGELGEVEAAFFAAGPEPDHGRPVLRGPSVYDVAPEVEPLRRLPVEARVGLLVIPYVGHDTSPFPKGISPERHSTRGPFANGPFYERPLLHQSGRRELGGVAWACGGAELDGRRRCYDLTRVDRRIEREGDPAFAVGRNGLLAQEGRCLP